MKLVHFALPVAPSRRSSVRADAAEDARFGALLRQARLSAAAVLRLPAHHPDVEDRAQDAMVAFLASGLPRFDPARGTHAALLGVIAGNAARSHLRRRATQSRLGAELQAEWPGAGGSDSDHRRVEAARDLGRILARLRPAHAEALVRIDLVGEPIADEARRLGKSYTAVNAQVGHARAFARQVARELMAA